jgi:hypothetical protein
MVAGEPTESVDARPNVRRRRGDSSATDAQPERAGDDRIAT